MAAAKTDHLLMNEVLGIIPARGGSKGIPKKNIALLVGRPLLAYTCDAALASRRLTRVVLSTDDEEIAEVGRKCGVEVPFMRPAELARDDTPSIAVVEHCLRSLDEDEAFRPEVVVLLQPTSPMREARHIDEALARMIETGADTVVSVVEVPHRFTPYSLMTLQDGWLRDFWREALPFDRFRRQNAPVLYARNGPAILGAKVSVLSETQSFYGGHVVPYTMSEENSIDIDTLFDLKLAALLMNPDASRPVK